MSFIETEASVRYETVNGKKVMIIMALTGFVTILSSTIADPVDVYFVGEMCMKKDDSWSVLAAIGT